MNGILNLARRALRMATVVPGLHSVVAFVAAKRVVVRGRSMLPALEPGERVLFDRLAYVLNSPTVGDIVLARHAARPGVRMIKRVAGLHGDDAPRRDGPQARLADATPAHILGPNEYWLLGDNPDESTDSRALGAFRRGDIVGRAWVVYWPVGRFRAIKRP